MMIGLIQSRGTMYGPCNSVPITMLSATQTVWKTFSSQCCRLGQIFSHGITKSITSNALIDEFHLTDCSYCLLSFYLTCNAVNRNSNWLRLSAHAIQTSGESAKMLLHSYNWAWCQQSLAFDLCRWTCCSAFDHHWSAWYCTNAITTRLFMAINLAWAQLSHLTLLTV